MNVRDKITPELAVRHSLSTQRAFPVRWRHWDAVTDYGTAAAGRTEWLAVGGLLPAHDDWTRSVVNDVVTNASHYRSSHLAETASSHDDHRDVFFLSHFTDDLSRLTAAFRPHATWYLHHTPPRYITPHNILNTPCAPPPQKMTRQIVITTTELTRIDQPVNLVN